MGYLNDGLDSTYMHQGVRSCSRRLSRPENATGQVTGQSNISLISTYYNSQCPVICLIDLRLLV